jgi:hypothetical protein
VLKRRTVHRISQVRVAKTHAIRLLWAGAGLATIEGVIWFYERRGEHLRCEIRQQLEGDRFALVVTLPDGSERVELFEDSRTLNVRSLELEKMLRLKGWDGPFARDI